MNINVVFCVNVSKLKDILENTELFDIIHDSCNQVAYIPQTWDVYVL